MARLKLEERRRLAAKAEQKRNQKRARRQVPPSPNEIRLEERLSARWNELNRPGSFARWTADHPEEVDAIFADLVRESPDPAQWPGYPRDMIEDVIAELEEGRDHLKE